jgi:hypothetical protein
MNYTSHTIKYIIKNLLYILPFAFIPAVFFSLSVSQEAVKSVLDTLFSGSPKESFWNVFQAISIFNFASWDTVLSGIVGMVAIVLCVAMLTAFLEKHMRIGKRTLNGVFSKVNDNIMSTLGLGIVFLGIYEVWAVLFSALCYLVTQIPNVALVYVLLSIVYLGMHFVLLYALSIFYLWLPCMQITGFRISEALRYSYHLVAPIQMNIVLSQWGFIMLSEALIAAAVVLVESAIVSFVVIVVLYTIMILVYCIRMHVIYFDRAEIDRADLNKYNFR